MMAAEQRILRLMQLAVAHAGAAATANRQQQQMQLLQAGVTNSCPVAHLLQEETQNQQQTRHKHKQQQAATQRHYTQQQQLSVPLLSGLARAVSNPGTLGRNVTYSVWQQNARQQQAWGPLQQQHRQQHTWQRQHALQNQAWHPWQQQQQQQQRGLHLAPPFLVDDYVPAAVTTFRQGRMPAKLKAAEKVSAANDALVCCHYKVSA
jgi:hypothetical protein